MDHSSLTRATEGGLAESDHRMAIQGKGKQTVEADHGQGLEDTMTPERRSERKRRGEAQRLADGLVEEAVREVPPSDMKQMLSLRMDPQLIRGLRSIASERGTTVSELLRDAAADIVNTGTVRPHVSYRMVPPTVLLGTTSPAAEHSRGEQVTPNTSPTRVSGYVATA